MILVSAGEVAVFAGAGGGGGGEGGVAGGQPAEPDELPAAGDDERGVVDGPGRRGRAGGSGVWRWRQVRRSPRSRPRVTE